MQDMEKGLDLITMAIKKGKKVAVYGDYDVDGVMSTTILSRTIEKCGGEVTYYVPHRPVSYTHLDVYKRQAVCYLWIHSQNHRWESGKYRPLATKLVPEDEVEGACGA